MGHAEGDAGVAQDARQGQHDFAALRVVCAHAAQPEAVLLGAVEEGEGLFGDELVAFGGWKAERVAGFFEGEGFGEDGESDV